MVNMKLRLFILLVCISSTVKCATFENVTVTLQRKFTEKQVVYISSGDKLSEFIGNETFMELIIYEENIPLLSENSVANLPDLEFIYMNKCGIEDIEPGAFKNLPKLFDISLMDNKIKTIRDGVFTNLTAFALSLSLNKLLTWSGEWVRGSSLQYIDLSSNQIEEIPENALAYLKPRNIPEILEIYKFDVRNNKVKKIHPKAFNGVDSFSRLDLSYNELTDIPVEMFAHTKRFYYVGLDFNRLSCFPLFEVIQVTNVSKVELKNNPFKRDCVKNWLENEEAKMVYFKRK